MAGKRQHYVPRFLQRGFLVTPPEAVEKTWLHRHGRKARSVSIRDVGVSEYFYSKLAEGNTATLDNLITDIEGGLNAELSAIRNASEGALLDPRTAARLTAHLALRTAHLRSVFEQGVGALIDELIQLVSDGGRMRDLLSIDKNGFSGARDALFDEARKGFPQFDEIPPRLLDRLFAYLIREGFDAFYEEQGEMISQAMALLVAGVSKMVRDAHNKSLMALDHSQWEEDLSSLEWRACAVEGAILPDCVVLVREGQNGFAPLTLREGCQMDLVVVPIAHNRLLVGSSGATPEIDIGALNRASASCSDDFFISHRARDEDGLSDLIGQRCSQVIDAAVQDAINEAGHRESSRTAVGAESMRIAGPGAAGPFSFSMSCKDFGDTETVERLGRVVQVVVQELARGIPLARLDGITFAGDYAAALAQVDRGDPNMSVVTSAPRDYGTAVAMCVDVMRAGEPKVHIVCHAGIAAGLLHEDEDANAQALHTLVTMLAQAAHSSLYEVHQDDAHGAQVDCTEARLHVAALGAPVRYFGAKVSAFAYPRAGEIYAQLTMDSLAAAKASVDAARLKYRIDANLDELLSVALHQFACVADHAAQWLGHRDGLPADASFPGDGLPEELRILGLHQWLDLLGRDLRALHEGDGLLPNSKLYGLSRHVERLLWTVQICPWSTEDQQMYVTVPMGTDAQALGAIHAG
ncbi:DUF4238 domain-containing protein [Roseateles sp. NT4]|uniref:DUF4238 domain-containing protein n=1 Tax=Roseateles sp. NT4 TaxID=3453715 RepID=UPI003EED9698